MPLTSDEEALEEHNYEIPRHQLDRLGQCLERLIRLATHSREDPPDELYDKIWALRNELNSFMVVHDEQWPLDEDEDEITVAQHQMSTLFSQDTQLGSLVFDAIMSTLPEGTATYFVSRLLNGFLRPKPQT